MDMRDVLLGLSAIGEMEIHCWRVLCPDPPGHDLGHAPQGSAFLRREVLQRRNVSAGHNEHVARGNGECVHECNDNRIAGGDAELPVAVQEITEQAGRRGCGLGHGITLRTTWLVVEPSVLGNVTIDRRDDGRLRHIRPGGGEEELGYMFLPATRARNYATEARTAALHWFREAYPQELMVQTEQVANVCFPSVSLRGWASPRSSGSRSTAPNSGSACSAHQRSVAAP